MTRNTLFTRLAGAGLLAALIALLVVPAAQAEPERGAKRARNSAFNLLGAGSTWNASINKVQCGLDNQGNICTDVTGSPLGGGGFWPTGSPNQYIFNSGLQIAGIVAPDAGIWAGDTVGAYIFDARGNQPMGQQLTLIYSSVDPDDVADWPNGAVVRDTAVYNDALIGRDAISQEDTWVRYWDGPGLLSGRTHPMGILVDQRSLAWNFPVGNESIIYFIFTFYNISASDPAAYANIDPAIRDEIAAIGADWVSQTEARVGVDIPPEGYTIDSLFAAFGMDPDVGDAGSNSSTAILPFQMGIAYKNDFDEPTWLFPPELNGPPFGPYPGFVGVKYLKSPVDPATGEQVGLTMFGNTTNPSAANSLFPDPLGVSQLWRYISGRVTTALGDPPCTINPPIQRRLCALTQAPTDTRFFQSSGPFSLEPGNSGTIVVAYVHAAPIGAEVAPFFGGNLPPGIPPNGADLAAGTDTLRVLEKAAGWVSATDGSAGRPANGVIEQDEVTTVKRSLLDKSLVAQALFDAKFLLPFAPEAPDFYLVPGDNQVTVVWQPSATETLGDPYYSIASDPTSPLYDQNYRGMPGEGDVEGYRIYRGRTRAQMELIAQFDYAGTSFVDYTGAWDYGTDCAPELGITGGCPTFPQSHDLNGEIPQVPAGGRVELADGSVLVLETVNAVEDAGFPALSNTGVPFAYVDNAVRNSTQYYYAVTAFDVNSIASGPGSLESPLQSQSITPRAPAPNVTDPVISAGLYGRGEKINTDVTFSMDAATGEFNGPPPPTNLASVAYVLFAPTALKAGATVTLTVDSVQPSYYDAEYWLTLDVDGQTSPIYFHDGPISSHDGLAGASPDNPIAGSIPADPTLAEATGQTGLPFAGQAAFAFQFGGTTFYSGDTEWHLVVDGSFWTSDGLTGIGGSRWFDGDNESTPMPGTPGWRGALTGVNTIESPQPYTVYALFRRIRQSTWHAARQADVKFYWGAAGTLDSVIDVTHNVVVPFDDGVYGGVGWGFRTDITGIGTSISAPDGVVTEYDFTQGPCWSPQNGGLPSHTTTGCETRPFEQTATLSPVDIDADGVADGNGFALYFNHEFYIFQADALPANTVWTHRSYFGLVDGTPGSYTYAQKDANPAVPGLTLKVTVDSVAAQRSDVADDLATVHTVPDPYYVTSGLEITPQQKVIKFVNLPDKAIIRIYSVSGVLVDVLEHSDQGLGGEETWDVRNRNNQFVASGVYFYHVETASGAEKVGRFTVINSGNLAIGQSQ